MLSSIKQNITNNKENSQLQFINSAKYYTLSISLIISFIFLIIYGIVNILNNSNYIGIIEIVISAFILATFIYTVKTYNVSITSTILILIFQTMAVYLFYTGGINNTGIYWIFLFPVTYFFYKGDKFGLYWFFLQISVMILLVILSKLKIITIAYNDTTILVSIIVLVIEATLLYIHEKALYYYASQIKILQGFLPICSSCKKIRDDEGYWENIETYIKVNSEADFSHGICPDCAKKLYPDIKRNKY